MENLLSKSGLGKLKSLPSNTLYAFDYDGTLTPIKRNPLQAVLSFKTAQLLKELKKIASIAIISGRSRFDLAQKIPFSVQYLIGNHGIENGGIHNAILQDTRKNCKIWHANILNSQLDPGIFIENKTYSLSIHYRNCLKPALTKKKLLRMIEKFSPRPQVILGKSVINLLGPSAPHKGEALLNLLSGFDAVFFIGDDETDEKVFALSHEKIFSVRVGKVESSKASYYILRQSQINQLLHSLIKLKKTKTKSPKFPKNVSIWC
jgi:trehalose 6-phosphate phosphatase